MEVDEMLVLSVILMLAGCASLAYGIIQNNDVEKQLESLFEKGSVNPGNVWIAIGAIALVIGIVLLIFHFVKRQKNAK